MVLRPDSNGGNGPSSNSPNGNSEFASANDTGPANIITEDPTCAAWGSISRDQTAVSDSLKWAERDRSVPATAWTPEQKNMYEAVGSAMKKTANITANLMKQTPHRVMRELYGQYIAYAHAFVDVIPSYIPDSDDSLANVTAAIFNGLSSVCGAIDYRSVQPVAPQLSVPAPPSVETAIMDTSSSQRFLTEANTICPEWNALADEYSKKTKSWREIDPAIPAANWTAEQRSVNDAAVSVMVANADEMERLGRRSGNAILEDFAVLAAQYRRAIAEALPKYTVNDNFLSEAGTSFAGAIHWACKAAS